MNGSLHLFRMGPDGAIWMSIGTSFLIQHNPTPNKVVEGLMLKEEREMLLNPLLGITQEQESIDSPLKMATLVSLLIYQRKT